MKYNKVGKIAIFAPNLNGGGAERVVSILATQFSENGYEVDLLLAEAKGPYLADLPDSVRVIDLQCKKVLFSLPKLVKYLRAEKPNVLFTSQMHASTVALWAAKIARLKTRVFIRQPTMLEPSYEKKPLSSRLRQKIFLKTAQLAEKVIVTSDAMANELHALSNVEKDKIEVIHNPVPVEVIKEKSLHTIEHPWFKVGEPPVILSVGRLVAVKDFQTLIQAFTIVQKNIPARLMILGEGPLREELEQLIANLGVGDTVQMPGFICNPYQYMKHAKTYALSSMWEGFPNGMIEAMACGAAIVATDCEGGTSEILEHGKWGKLVPVGDEAAMAKAILETLAADNLPNVLERVDSFSIQSIREKYINTFGV